MTLGKSSKSDDVIAILDDAIAVTAEKWLYYCNTLKIKSDVTLQEQIFMFLAPATEGLKNGFPALNDAPETIFLVIVAKAVVRSGTHTSQQVEQALGVQLPQ